jgi:hypothetical protein
VAAPSAEGLAQVFRREASPYESACFPLRGLAPPATYELTDLDASQPWRASGRQLLEQGLFVTFGERPQAESTGKHQKALKVKTSPKSVRSMITPTLGAALMHCSTVWRAGQAQPHFLSLTDFQAAMGEDDLAKTQGFVTHHRPTL